MRLLVDTHLLLWAAVGDDQLPQQARKMIEDPASSLVFSSASIWEIVIKSKLGRDDFKVNPHLLRTRLLENGYDELAVTSDHALAVAILPDIHKDPFDRILIAQATIEMCTLLTCDLIVASYSGPIVKV